MVRLGQTIVLKSTRGTLYTASPPKRKRDYGLPLIECVYKLGELTEVEYQEWLNYITVQRAEDDKAADIAYAKELLDNHGVTHDL